MNQSQTISCLLEAMCGFQSELEAMPKNSSGYGYRYTDLDTIASKIRPLLAKYGLGYMQPIETVGDTMFMRTRVFHKSGEYIETDIVLNAVSGKQMNAIQQMGAAITYMRRYSLCSVLGITSDEDTDGAEKKEAPGTQNKQPVKPQPTKQVTKPVPNTQGKKTQLAGGDSTPEQVKALKSLFASKYDDGTPIFSVDDMKAYSDMRKTKTADEVIALVEDVADRRYQEFINKTVDGEAAE